MLLSSGPHGDQVTNRTLVMNAPSCARLWRMVSVVMTVHKMAAVLIVVKMILLHITREQLLEQPKTLLSL